MLPVKIHLSCVQADDREKAFVVLLFTMHSYPACDQESCFSFQAGPNKSRRLYGRSFIEDARNSFMESKELTAVTAQTPIEISRAGNLKSSVSDDAFFSLQSARARPCFVLLARQSTSL